MEVHVHSTSECWQNAAPSRQSQEVSLCANVSMDTVEVRSTTERLFRASQPASRLVNQISHQNIH